MSNSLCVNYPRPEIWNILRTCLNGEKFSLFRAWKRSNHLDGKATNTLYVIPKECPLNGVCRRCRQPGHVARDCRRAWGDPSPKPSRGRASARQAPAADQPAASAAVSDSSPPGDASVEVVSDSAPVDEEMCSGDEEVVAGVAGAAEVAATAASSSRPAPRRRPRKDRGAVPFPPPGTIGFHRLADLSPMVMDPSEDDEGSKFLHSFHEVWHDQLTWEELRSLRHGRVLKMFGGFIHSILFGSASDVDPQPVEGTVPDPFRMVRACAFGNPLLIELLCTPRMMLLFPTSVLRLMVISPMSLLILAVALRMSSMTMTSVLSASVFITMKIFRTCDL